MIFKIYSGAGNDFVMINNLDNLVPFNKQKDFTIKICNEKFKQIDGVIFLEKPQGAIALVRMSYYNRDGSYGAMCGNGARCIAQFAVDEGVINTNEFSLESVDRLYKAEIKTNNIIKIHFPPPDEYKLNIEVINAINEQSLNLHWVQVGSEHIVLFINDEENKEILAVNNLDKAKINEWGEILRFHEYFQPNGANVNFVDVVSSSEISIRTYERGVERETLACGTGIISSAIISSLLGKVTPPVKVLVQSGERLTVDFKNNNRTISDLSLKGSARKIEEGEI
jgi:diaminopimelate epimerase